MGYGSWDAISYKTYSSSMGRTTTSTGNLSSDYSVQDIFKARGLDEKLSPYKVIRVCHDSEDHPHTIPVILALDVTGSMGKTLEEVAKRLNEVMTKLYSEVSDVEFLIMGIGDLVYDQAPIQISQFEADVRIAEWLDKIWFERGGGGNAFESYTAAWYMGLKHTELDCWKRGEKGLIITLGDEPLNPYIPKEQLERATGDILQGDVETNRLYMECSEKYDIHHIAVDGGWDNCYGRYEDWIRNSFGQYLGENLHSCKIDELVDTIVKIVVDHANMKTTESSGMPIISW